jgi:serine carboxypeptidase-like clade 1
MHTTGLFVEMGPLLLSSQSVRTAAYNETGVPTLYRNPYAWTKVANVLILNGPAPVGYSFCTPAGPSGDGNSCGCVVAHPPDKKCV